MHKILSRLVLQCQRTIATGLSITVLSLTAANIAYAGVSETGTNFPEPVVSGTTNSYSIGAGAAGTLTINGGTQFTAGGLSAGDRGPATEPSRSTAAVPRLRSTPLVKPTFSNPATGVLDR